MTFDAGRSSGCQVAFFIADKKASRRIDRPAPQQVDDHPWSGFSPVAFSAVAGDGAFRVEGAVAEIVDMRTCCGKLSRHMHMHRPNIVFGIIAVCDTRLVGDDKNEKAAIVERFDGCLGAVDPTEPRDRTDVAVIMIEHAVAVEKDRRSAAPDGISCLALARSAGTPISMK